MIKRHLHEPVKPHWTGGANFGADDFFEGGHKFGIGFISRKRTRRTQRLLRLEAGLQRRSHSGGFLFMACFAVLKAF